MSDQTSVNPLQQQFDLYSFVYKILLDLQKFKRKCADKFNELEGIESDEYMEDEDEPNDEDDESGDVEDEDYEETICSDEYKFLISTDKGLKDLSNQILETMKLIEKQLEQLKSSESSS